MPDVNSFSGFGLGPAVFGRALDYVASQPHRAFSFIALSKSCKRIPNTDSLSQVAVAAQDSDILMLGKPAAKSSFSEYLLFCRLHCLGFFFVCLFVSWFFLCHSGVLPIFASQAALKVCIWLCCTIWKYTSCGLALL